MNPNKTVSKEISIDVCFSLKLVLRWGMLILGSRPLNIKCFFKIKATDKRKGPLEDLIWTAWDLKLVFLLASMLWMSWGGPWGRWGRNCTWILSGTENNTSYLSEVSPFHLLKTVISPSPTCLQALWPTGRKQIHAVYGLDFRPALPSSPLCELLWWPHLSLSQP